ncbi:MAG: phosphoribosyltransferase family protein [Candidatus Colwellbacteria bacterium]|nr:phosphoribosyltransferase family protein [Candidatus Colwellbacteria bacterium]
MIGKVLSEELGLNMEIRGFRKIKNTDAQMGIKDRGKRKNNVKGCFVADGEQFSGRNILLVDDVYTSGATIREAAGALRKAGAKEIDVFVLAKAG